MSNSITATNNATSTNYDPTYSRNNIVSAKLTTIGNTQSYVTEFFAIGVIRLLREAQLTKVGMFGTVPVTTQANKLYRNTTCWWMIGLINGFGNPLAVDPSTVLGYPDVTVYPNITNVVTTININQSNVTI